MIPYVRRRLVRVSQLEREMGMLIGSTGVNLALGLLFWVAVARIFPTEATGRATTIVAVASSLVVFTGLGLGPVLERFAGRAGHRRRELVAGAYLVVGTLTVAVAAVFWLFDPVDLLARGSEAIAFVLLALVLAGNALQDSDLISARAASLVAVKNVAVSASKLLVVVAASLVGTALAIVASWLLPAAAAIIGFATIESRRRTADERRHRTTGPTLPPRPELAGFWGATYGWLIAGALPGLVVPLVVVEAVGLEAAAHFNATWMIISASAVLMSLASGPYIAAAARPESDLPALTRQFIRSMIVFGILRGVGLAVGGSLALLVFGAEFARAGIPLLLVMAGLQTLAIPAYVYGGLARVHRRVWHPMLVQALGSLVIVALTPAAIREWGIVGIGYVYLLQEVVILTLAAGPLVRYARRSLAPGAQAA